MVRPNYNLIRFIRRCIRQMKKEYGNAITVYALGTVDTDYDTGVKTETHTSVFIRRAVVLPVNLTRDVIQTISMISANKKVVQGGTFDPGIRRFIIDRTDVPATWTVKKDDWIVYDGKRYDVKTAEEYEYKTAWLVTAKLIEGAPVYEDHHVKADGYLLDLTQTATAVIA
ncbi:MAG: hypothetical protein ACYS7Y_29270 [Planctomycetota bacterium]|jgi:hypothetical protein